MLTFVLNLHGGLNNYEAAINSLMESTMGTDSEQAFEGLFDDMQLDSTKLGRTVKDRSSVMSKIISTLTEVTLDMENTQIDILGNAYEYLIGQFAANAGKKAGEFYTPSAPAELLAMLACDGLTDIQDACDPTCGSGSLLLRLQNHANVRRFWGQELTSQTYKGAILDAVDEGKVERDPTRKAIIKGKTPPPKKIKYLDQYDLHTLLKSLDLGETPNWDHFILIVAKTGLRFSEALALTPADFDFDRQTLSVSKTWDYKGKGGFLPTKNRSSVRKIQLDWQTIIRFSELIKKMPSDKPIFAEEGKRVFNSTINGILNRRCKAVGIPAITVHGLRHTHASILLFAGVSIGSVARRLGHASMTTTQKTYLHIIQELENQDIDIVMRSMPGLN